MNDNVRAEKVSIRFFGPSATHLIRLWLDCPMHLKNGEEFFNVTGGGKFYELQHNGGRRCGGRENMKHKSIERMQLA